MSVARKINHLTVPVALVLAVLCGLLLVTPGCDSHEALMDLGEEPEDSTKVEVATPDSIILLFSIGYVSETTGFFNTEQFGEVDLIDRRSNHAFFDGVEGVWMPLVSPSNDKLVYFQNEQGRVTLVEGSTVEELKASSRTDFERTVRVADAYWGVDEDALYYPTGFGIASSGQFTTFRMDLQTGSVEVIKDDYTPVGHSKDGNMLLRSRENLAFYELDKDTRVISLFSHRVLRGSVTGVEWNNERNQYTYAYSNRDDRWIGITDSTGVDNFIVESTQNGSLAFGKPRWGKDGDIYFSRYERAGDRPTAIYKYNADTRTGSVYLTAQQLGFDSNTIQLADILRLTRKN